MENLKALAYELRENVIDMIVEGKAGHIGGDMSVMEILTEIYFDQMNISPENIRSIRGRWSWRAGSLTSSPSSSRSTMALP